MAEYVFCVVGGISLHVTVQADSLSEAREKAGEAPLQSFCHQCSTGDPDEWSTSGELDCDPSSAELAYASCDGESVPLDSPELEGWSK